MDAPLSSPTHTRAQHATMQNSYFAAHTTSTSSSSSSNPTSAPHQTQSTTQSQAQQQQKQQRGNTAATETASHFLQDFNLVAEAAKRAQMAVLMRDLEAVGI